MRLTKVQMKVAAYNLQDVLVTLVIVGILLLLALPNLMPLIAKAKSQEAQLHLKQIYNSETTYRYMYSKYTPDMSQIDYEAPKTVNEGRMKENRDLIGWRLNQKEMESIDGLNKNRRFNDPGVFCELAFGTFFPIYE